MKQSQGAMAAVLICWCIAVALAVSAWAQPPQRNSGGPMQRGSGPTQRNGDFQPMDGGPGGQGARPEPGSVIPPFVRDQLKLTEDQKKKSPNWKLTSKASSRRF